VLLALKRGRTFAAAVVVGLGFWAFLRGSWALVNAGPGVMADRAQWAELVGAAPRILEVAFCLVAGLALVLLNVMLESRSVRRAAGVGAAFGVLGVAGVTLAAFVLGATVGRGLALAAAVTVAGTAVASMAAVYLGPPRVLAGGRE